ncbi:MAG: SH3 domain-containing protein [Anaerolineae bacterium]|jgi:tetratricopeptide (TPR) repeat protein|nr:SH3 domain-containing protein [Anaerolineae bacterium]
MAKFLKCGGLLLLLIVLLPARARAQEPAAAALAACAAGEVAAAVAQLEAASLPEEATVLYNAGVCYTLAGQPGPALAVWLRAQTLAPRDGELQAALARLRLERPDPPEDETDVLALLAAPAALLTLPEQLLLLALTWAGLWLLLALSRLRPRWRAGLRVAMVGGLCLLLAGVIVTGSRAYLAAYRPAAVVLAPAPVFSGPGADYLRLFSLAAAAEVRVIEARDDWRRVLLPGGRQGWLPAAALRRVDGTDRAAPP